jgi:Uma2 family endonuclease
VQRPIGEVSSATSLAHYQAPEPVVFPVEEEVPETKRHLNLRTLLFQVLERAVSDRASVGSEQFVYWRASEPRACLSPDVFVKLGVPDTTFDCWKSWEKGSPELAIEFISKSDKQDLPWGKKLRRYHDLGVQELVRFDPDCSPGKRIRVWDRIDGDLVERVVTSDVTPCRPLGLWWVVRPTGDLPLTLRLAADEIGTHLLPSPSEAALRELAETRAEVERLRNARGS